jgi:predicted component of type VI protein secretion system
LRHCRRGSRAADGQRADDLSAQAAAREATADLKSHELAVMVGMQAALSALLSRFDPDALEARMAQGRLD